MFIFCAVRRQWGGLYASFTATRTISAEELPYVLHYRIKTPLTGGFVKESPLRYIGTEKSNDTVKVYAAYLNKRRYAALYRRLEYFASYLKKHIYDSYLAGSYSFRKRIKISNAYT